MDDEETRRRIRAARVLAGIKSVGELADLIGEQGLGRDTLYDIERGRRPVRAHELREIARVCGLPYEWFTVESLGAAVHFSAGMDEADREIRAGGYDPPADPALERLDEIERGVARLVATVEPTPGDHDVAERLTAIERTLEDFTETWAEQVLPVVARLSSSDLLPGEGEATAETDQPRDSRAGGQAG